jgi:hypothetical protein
VEIVSAELLNSSRMLITLTDQYQEFITAMLE